MDPATAIEFVSRPEVWGTALALLGSGAIVNMLIKRPGASGVQAKESLTVHHRDENVPGHIIVKHFADRQQGKP